MAYCAEQGIPHSHFLGGPPVWRETDRAKVIAFTIERGERCPSCGTAPWEWMADRGAYIATTEICQGCLRRDAVSEDNASANPGGSAKGSRVVLLPRAAAEEISRNPAAYTVDSPSARRARRREQQADT